MDPYQDEECLGRYAYPGLTTGLVSAELSNQPLISKYWQKNTQETQNRLVQAMMIVPSKSDCPGYIYGFRNQADYIPEATSYEIKMGRTKRSVPQQRIFEWQRDDNHKYVQIFTIRSEYNMKLQALVHLLFAYARKTLIINGKRRIEWFGFEEKVPTAAVVNLLNLIMEKLHQLAKRNSEAINKIEEQIQLRNENTRKQKKQLGRLLEDLKITLGQFIQAASAEFVLRLRQLVRVNNIKQLKSALNILLQILALQSQKDKEVINVDSDDEPEKKSAKVQEIIKKIEKIRKFLSFVEENESTGMTTKDATEKVKQSIYLFLMQNPIKQVPSKQEKSPPSTKEQSKQSTPNSVEKKKIIQSYFSEESETAFTVQKNTQSVSQQKMIQNSPKYERQQNTKQLQDQISKLNFSKGKMHSKSQKLSQVYDKLKQIQSGDTFLNIIQGDFIIDCSKRVSHNIIIIAQTVKVYHTWNISFNSVAQSQIGAKLNLVIAAKEFINYDKLHIPKQSKNGYVSVLYFQEDGNVIGLDDVLKENPEKMKNQFYGEIKRLFKQHIK